MNEFTDDDISELAECLWDACEKLEMKGGSRIRPGGGVCPIKAAFDTWCPPPFIGCVTWSFIFGFEGDSLDDLSDPGEQDVRLFDLGRKFREQALSPEGFR